jgi:hypothetical protein
VSLSLRHRVDHRADAAQRVERHRRGGQRTALWSSASAFLGGQNRRDVAHVRYRRLDDRGKANAVESSRFARLVAPRAELGKTALHDRGIDGREIVA